MHDNEVTSPYHMGPVIWAEMWWYWLPVTVVVALLVVILVFRRTPRQSEPLLRHLVSVIPEAQLLRLALPLELLWEIAQLPLYNVWHQDKWSNILYDLAHCTLGDLLILLAAYELVALLAGGRTWYRSTPSIGSLLFTFLGVVYTVYSESVNVRIKGTWGYTDLMPIVPLLNIGGAPFLQWLMIPPALIWLMRQLPNGRMPPTAT